MTEIKKCNKHGETIFSLYATKEANRWRCRKCIVDSVIKNQRNRKIKLVDMFGGKCSECGYNKYVGALQFHHLDPKTKSFGIAGGYQRYAMAKLIEEAKKCIILCANCHAELENKKREVRI